MSRLFELIHPAPLSRRIRSRQNCTYMYRVMMFVGWIPPKQGSKRYLYMFWTCYVFVLASVYFPISLICSLIFDSKRFTPGEFLNVLQLCCNIVGASFKSLTILKFLSHLHETRALLDTLDKRLRSDSDNQKIHKVVAKCNYIFLVYGQLYFGYAVSDFVAGLVNNQPPWMMYNPLFDWRSGTGSLWLQSMFEFMVMFLMASVILIMDTYTIMFLNIFRAHIDVLKDHIRALRTDPTKTEAENYEELVGCISYHKSILECCALMRPVMTRTIFIQFLLIGIVLGLTLINVLYFSDFFRGLSSVIFVAAVLVETFPFCYFCDLLVADCTEMSNLLAQSNWIGADSKYKSALRIFLQHVQHPILFVAGGIFPISLGSNIKVAKFAFSVMTIVQQMNLADRFK